MISRLRPLIDGQLAYTCENTVRCELLADFRIDLHAYAVMANHVHLVLRPRPDLVASLSGLQVAEAGHRTMPVRGGNGRAPLPATAELHARMAAATAWQAEYRSRLGSVSWFMRCLAKLSPRNQRRLLERLHQETTMLDIAAILKAEGRAEGKAEGKAEGLIALIRLQVARNRMTVDEARAEIRELVQQGSITQAEADAALARLG